MFYFHIAIYRIMYIIGASRTPGRNPASWFISAKSL